VIIPLQSVRPNRTAAGFNADGAPSLERGGGERGFDCARSIKGRKRHLSIMLQRLASQRWSFLTPPRRRLSASVTVIALTEVPASVLTAHAAPVWFPLRTPLKLTQFAKTVISLTELMNKMCYERCSVGTGCQ
jgi:hypothetical protein